jgi:hypothetical protein
VVRRRGDDIPPVSAYAHWNEDAQRVWYEENRYDMEHADEIIEEDDDWLDPNPFEDSFATEAEARAFIAKHRIDISRDTLSEWAGEWIVEHYDKAAHAARMRTSSRRNH